MRNSEVKELTRRARGRADVQNKQLGATTITSAFGSSPLEIRGYDLPRGISAMMRVAAVFTAIDWRAS